MNNGRKVCLLFMLDKAVQLQVKSFVNKSCITEKKKENKVAMQLYFSWTVKDQWWRFTKTTSTSTDVLRVKIKNMANA